MKIPKVLWIFLAVALVVGGSAWLFTRYNAATKEKSSAEVNLANTQKLKDQLLAEEPGLNSQLAQASAAIEDWQTKIAGMQGLVPEAESRLAQAESQLPDSIEGLDYDEILLAMARASGLDVLNLETSAPGDSAIEGHTGFVATTFKIDVRGKASDILDLYSLITSDPNFRTAEVESVSCQMPMPMSEADKAAAAQDYYSELLKAAQDSLTVEDRVLLIEEAVLDLLEEPYEHVTVDAMTQRVQEAIASRFGAGVSTRLAQDIADALENELSTSLIDTIAGIYGQAAGELFKEGDPQLTPGLLGILGPDLSDALRTMPPNLIPGIVSDVISKKLQAMVQADIEGMVDQAEITRKVDEMASASELASASITVTVSVYTGGADEQS